MKDLITVVINVYNGEKFIDKCLNCVINQTYKKLDILIVDDGSTDNTLKFVKKYKDKRIRVISQKNHGLSYSRNVALDNIKGKYLYFVDADDYIDLDTIEYLYKLLKKYNTKVSTSECFLIKDNIKEKQVEEEKTEKIESIVLLKKILTDNRYHGTIWNKLFDKSVFDDIRFEDRIINDVVIVYKLFLNSEYIAYSNLKKYYYVKHNTNATVVKNIDRQIDLYKGSLERYDYIKKYYDNLIENDVCILIVIMSLYSQNNYKVNEFLGKVEAKKEYNKHFSLKIFKSSATTKQKIKLLLFRINKHVFLGSIKTYLFIKRKVLRKY